MTQYTSEWLESLDAVEMVLNLSARGMTFKVGMDPVQEQPEGAETLVAEIPSQVEQTKVLTYGVTRLELYGREVRSRARAFVKEFAPDAWEVYRKMKAQAGGKNEKTNAYSYLVAQYLVRGQKKPHDQSEDDLLNVLAVAQHYARNQKDYEARLAAATTAAQRLTIAADEFVRLTYTLEGF